MMRKVFLIPLLFLSGCVHAQQIVITCAAPTPCPVAQTIKVTASPTVITIGGTSALSAQLYDSNGLPNVFITDRCSWTSSNPAVLSVNGATATGVTSGTATANCTLSGLTGSTPVSISVGRVVITNPTCGTPP